MSIKKIAVSAIVAGCVLFAAAPAAINATVSESTANIQPVSYIVTGYSTRASAGIAP